MPTGVETTRLACQKEAQDCAQTSHNIPRHAEHGMNAQRYVRVRLKALGAINISDCHADGLRGPTGGPKTSSSNETIAAMARVLSWVLGVRTAVEM